MIINVNEAQGVVLDWLVAKAQKIEVVAWITEDRKAYFVVLKEDFTDKLPTTFYGDPESTYYPSARWDQAGPIIESHAISLNFDNDPGYLWAAWTPAPLRDEAEAFGYGNAMLIAAMRCYVISKLGDQVEVPDEIGKN